MPFSKLRLVERKAADVLERIARGDEPISVDRVQNAIHKLRLEILRQVEERPGRYFSQAIIEDHLYAGDGQAADLRRRLGWLDMLPRLLEAPADYWRALLERTFVHAPRATIVSEPSAALAQQMQQAEHERIAEQRASLGPTKLAELGRRVDEANRANATGVPRELLLSMPIPGVDSIRFHTISTRRTDESAGAPLALPSLPYAMQIDHMSSAFVHTSALLDTSEVPAELRPYLLLLLGLLFESPVRRDGARIPHDEVVGALEADTLVRYAQLGFGRRSGRFSCGNFAQIAVIGLKADRAKAASALRWLHDVLFGTLFECDRIRVVAQRLLNDATSYRRDGRMMARALIHEVRGGRRSGCCCGAGVAARILRGVRRKHSAPAEQIDFGAGAAASTNVVATMVLRQQTFLATLLSRTEHDAAGVAADLERLRSLLVTPPRMALHLAGELDAPIACMAPFSRGTDASADVPASRIAPSTVQRSHALLHRLPDGALRAGQCVVAGLASVESSFLVQSVECIRDEADADVAPLLVVAEALTAVEVAAACRRAWRHCRRRRGPRWPLIGRPCAGTALAYSARPGARLLLRHELLAGARIAVLLRGSGNACRAGVQ